ncbi:MAG: hypothetical protein QNJ97_18165 [Myxococcota bacterium]|nr:hypothetical protein [Myxococcota bacterium]
MFQGCCRWFSDASIFNNDTRAAIRCRCSRGHIFTAEVPVSLNLKTSRATMDEIAILGYPLAVCPECQIECPVAVPVVVRDPQKKRAAVFVPTPISYLELHFRAVFFEKLSTADPSTVPSYFGDAQMVVGPAALIAWMDAAGNNVVPQPNVASVSAQSLAHASMSPSAMRVTETDGMRPAIHEAFADLNRSEDLRPSSVPPELDPDGAEDDWLDDAVITDAKKKPQPLPASRSVKEGAE